MDFLSWFKARAPSLVYRRLSLLRHPFHRTFPQSSFSAISEQYPSAFCTFTIPSPSVIISTQHPTGFHTKQGLRNSLDCWLNLLVKKWNNWIFARWFISAGEEFQVAAVSGPIAGGERDADGPLTHWHKSSHFDNLPDIPSNSAAMKQHNGNHCLQMKSSQ